MQVFVKRADLVADPPPDLILVIAQYADTPPVPYSAHGDPANVTAIYLPSVYIVRNTLSFPGGVNVQQTVLADNWRDNAEGIINNEAGRRIEEVFPDYKQRNSTATFQQAQTAYGSDTTVWPVEAKDFKNEYDRGWAYVNAVREVSTALIPAMPPDPTADSYWPTRIDPVSFSPIF